MTKINNVWITFKMLTIGFIFQFNIAAIMAGATAFVLAIVFLISLTIDPESKYVAPNIDISKCQIVDTISDKYQIYKISCKR